MLNIIGAVMLIATAALAVSVLPPVPVRSLSACIGAEFGVYPHGSERRRAGSQGASLNLGQYVGAEWGRLW
jgi:hypothetical protein